MVKRIILATVLLVIAANRVFAVTFGETGTGTTTLYHSLNEAVATYFTCSSTGNINRIVLYVPTPSGANGRVAVYSSSAYLPSALLAESGSQPLLTGWNTFIIPDTAVTAGTTYWLTYQVSDYNTAVGASNDADNNRLQVRSWTYGAFADPFGTPDYPYGYRASIYASEVVPSPTYTPIGTSTYTPTPSVTMTSTPTPTITPTGTPTRTMTITPSRTVSATYTATPTITRTASATPTSTVTMTFSATPTVTRTPTITQTSTHTPIHTPTVTPTITMTRTITRTATITQTRTITQTATISPTSTISPTVTISPTITRTATPLQSASTLDAVVVYPNPWRGDLPWVQPRIVFLNLTENAVIRIYSVDGRLVYTLNPDTSDHGGRTHYGGNTGRAQWGLANQNGVPVASGVYVVLIRDPAGHEFHGKIALMR